ncbi:MAG TPA: type II toxin-antitoxin system prevent-host-death family antitoxin [Candidatus Limnocylindrales bacterium]|nr:type II toxin-antitoxin system prevent-host-death family antitoxin [Candidatus Limnocylindrales bacterium]
MKTYNVHEAKTHLSRLLEQAESGEEIVIARAGRPIVRLQPVTINSRRVPGIDRGRVIIHPDFDEPLPELDPDYEHPDDPLRDEA